MKNRIHHALAIALIAVDQIEKHGCTVHKVEIGDRRPVITIDTPNSMWINGAMRRRETLDGISRTVVAAPFHGCQVEWTVTENRGKEAIRA